MNKCITFVNTRSPFDTRPRYAVAEALSSRVGDNAPSFQPFSSFPRSPFVSLVVLRKILPDVVLVFGNSLPLYCIFLREASNSLRLSLFSSFVCYLYFPLRTSHFLPQPLVLLLPYRCEIDNQNPHDVDRNSPPLIYSRHSCPLLTFLLGTCGRVFI